MRPPRLKRMVGQTGAMEPELRRAARLLVVDTRNAVFLFQYEDDGRRWWATPGGGLEEGESFEDAAAREAAEELCLTGIELTRAWEGTAEFSFQGRYVRQVERYFVLRLEAGAAVPGTVMGEVHRRENIVDGRWWSAAELAATSERVFPTDLCERLAELAME